MHRKSSQMTALIGSILDKGQFRVGDKIPTEAELGARFGFSRTTVREGLSSLVQKGILEKRRGSGTYLVSPVPLKPKCKIIGAIVPSVSVFGQPGIYYDIIQGIENAAHNKGYSLIIGNMDNDQKKAEMHIARFIDNNVCGVIYSPLILPDYEQKNIQMLEEMDRKNISVVVVNSMVGKDWGGRFSFVGSNHFLAMVEVVKYLASLGHTHIAYIRCFHGVSSSDQQFAGFSHQIHAEELSFHEEYIKTVQFGNLDDMVHSQGAEEIRQLLALKTPPTAVICTNDYVASNVISETKKLGLKVPDDLAVIGFDDRPFSPYLDPPLTTVRQPLYEEGFQACEILINKLNGYPSNDQKFLDCKLIKRQSCGKIQEQRQTNATGTS